VRCAIDRSGGNAASVDRYAGEKKYVVCVIFLLIIRVLCLSGV
jgi:hypothetical protein